MLVSVVKMESPTLQELTENGRKMELKGTDLQKFLDQQTHYRYLRAAERSKEKEEREYQLKREELDLERMKAKGIAEAESKYKETLLKLEQQLQETKADMSSNASALCYSTEVERRNVGCKP